MPQTRRDFLKNSAAASFLAASPSIVCGSNDEESLQAQLNKTAFDLGLPGFVSMGAILGGTMRSPFTGIVFAIELTHDFNMLLPLVVASFLAHGFTVLTLKRSILTEKIARRGYHLTREYAVDPLEILFVREVMRTNVVALPAAATFGEAHDLVRPGRKPHGQHVFPIVDEDECLVGVISRSDL
jgi:CIC family chloride channel protein